MLYCFNKWLREEAELDTGYPLPLIAFPSGLTIFFPQPPMRPRRLRHPRRLPAVRWLPSARFPGRCAAYFTSSPGDRPGGAGPPIHIPARRPDPHVGSGAHCALRADPSCARRPLARAQPRVVRSPCPPYLRRGLDCRTSARVAVGVLESHGRSLVRAVNT